MKTETYIDTLSFQVTEEIECFQDRWNEISETHYTEDYIDVQENIYHIEVLIDDQGNVVSDIETKINQVAKGKVRSFKCLY